MKKAILMLCACSIASVANAAEFWSDLTTIYTIYPHQDGLTFTVGYANPMSTCNSGTRWVISKKRGELSNLDCHLDARILPGSEDPISRVRPSGSLRTASRSLSGLQVIGRNGMSGARAIEVGEAPVLI
jgi:hypothetical protein